MGSLPQLVDGYRALIKLFTSSPLDATEQHVVWLTASFENECRYCMAAHSSSAESVGVDHDIIDRLRGGEPLEDSRLESLRRFTGELVRGRGRVDDETRHDLIRHGYDDDIRAVILGVAQKVLTNYTSHLFGELELDERFARWEWAPPAR